MHQFFEVPLKPIFLLQQQHLSKLTLSTFDVYCQGFLKAFKTWPQLPLPPESELAWWETLLGNKSQDCQDKEVIKALTAALPQLRLPQVQGISKSEIYRALVLRGDDPEKPELQDAINQLGCVPQWQQPENIKLWITPHPCGAMPVLETPNLHDFVLLVRALAHRAEPVVIADGVHAQAISGLIHRGLIKQLGRNSRARLIVLHDAPYGSVPTKHVPGKLTDLEWLEASTTLRLQHELTHLATKRLLGEMRLNLLDELIADCMGMVAALGFFDANLFGLCLGIDVQNDDAPLANGRWISYVGGLSSEESFTANRLVLKRAKELECQLLREKQLLHPNQAMQRLQWLCKQQLNMPISAP